MADKAGVRGRGSRRRFYQTPEGHTALEYTDERLDELPSDGIELVLEVPPEDILRLDPVTVVFSRARPRSSRPDAAGSSEPAAAEGTPTHR